MIPYDKCRPISLRWSVIKSYIGLYLFTFGDLYRVLGSKLSLNQPSQTNQQQQHQQHLQQLQQMQRRQQSVAIVQTRPSIASMLNRNNASSADENDDNDGSSPRRQPPSTNSKPSGSASDADKIIDSSNSTISTTSSLSSRRLQKQVSVASAQGRTSSQSYSRQSEYGSMMSQLNYSMPQLNNVENVVLYASQNGLNRAGETFCEKGLGVAESTEASEHSLSEFYKNLSDKTPQPSSASLNSSVAKGGVEDPNGRQKVCFEGDVAQQSRQMTDDERRLSEFTEFEESLQTSLNYITQQLDSIQTTCTSLTSPADLETLENLFSQFAQNEQKLVQLTSACGEVQELTDSVEVVKAVQDKVTEMTSLVAVTRKRLNDTRVKVQAIFEKHQCSKIELRQLMDWLSDTNQRLIECTQRPSVSTVTAEQQLGQLLTLIHEFNAHRNRFTDLENCSGLDLTSVDELMRQFERVNEACRVGLERQRGVFSTITELRSNIQQIAGWVAKVGPLYTLDSGAATGSLEMLEENHSELENRLEEAAQIKEKAVEFLASLKPTEDGQAPPELGQEAIGHVEDESCLIQPLLEVQCQMYQLRELIATRAANSVCLLMCLCLCLPVSCGGERQCPSQKVEADQSASK